jgi:hypothetical protein
MDSFMGEFLSRAKSTQDKRRPILGICETRILGDMKKFCTKFAGFMTIRKQNQAGRSNANCSKINPFRVKTQAKSTDLSTQLEACRIDNE